LEVSKGRLVVVGGGPAGFFCAVNAARMNPSLEVTIAEKTAHVLSKVKRSGGGRCNLTHACSEISEMAERYPRGKSFVRKGFHRFFTTDTVQWFEQRGVRIKEEPDGRMFPETDSSQTVIDCLLREARRHHVRVVTGKGVTRLNSAGGRWLVGFEGGEVEADFVCLACGGYRSKMSGLLQGLGHNIVEPVPSLFTFRLHESGLTTLMGVTVQDVSVGLVGTRFRERGPLLITHWGLSGPAVLGLSSRAARELAAMGYRFQIRISWVPGSHEGELRSQLQVLQLHNPGRKIRNGNPFAIPQRLWEFQLDESGVDRDLHWGRLPARQREKLIRNLAAQEFPIKGRGAHKGEFVTAGGISLSEVDVNTMMSKIHPRLFFAGEILDVDGLTGGYNLQHAWTSGYIAALGVSAAAGSNLFRNR
jgi:predicted Rossmann fold flavoprotein